MTIRPLKHSDFDQWLPLWQENCLHQISDDITAETWRRLTNKNEKVFGLGAFSKSAVDKNNKLVGFLHYILHPTTGYINPACYMQDLFVEETARRQGIAKQLVWNLNDIGTSQNWSRIYWFAENKNDAVQALYKDLGIKMDFSLFMLPVN